MHDIWPSGSYSPQCTGDQKCDYCHLYYSVGMSWSVDINGKEERKCMNCQDVGKNFKIQIKGE